MPPLEPFGSDAELNGVLHLTAEVSLDPTTSPLPATVQASTLPFERKNAQMSRFAPHRASNSNPRASADTVCQKCLGRGHFTYNCTAKARPYVSRPSRTQMLERPEKFGGSSLAGGKRGDGPSVEVPNEFLSRKGLADKILKQQAAQREAEEATQKRKLAIKGEDSSSSSSSDSDSSSSDSSSSRSRSRQRQKQTEKRKRSASRSSSSSSSKSRSVSRHRRNKSRSSSMSTSSSRRSRSAASSNRKPSHLQAKSRSKSFSASASSASRSRSHSRGRRSVSVQKRKRSGSSGSTRSSDEGDKRKRKMVDRRDS